MHPLYRECTVLLSRLHEEEDAAEDAAAGQQFRDHMDDLARAYQVGEYAHVVG